MSSTPTTPVRPRTGGRQKLAAVLAVLFVLLPVAAQPASAHPAPLKEFDPDQTSWTSIRNQSSEDFADYFQEQVDKGLMVIDLEVDVIEGRYEVGAVFVDNPDDRGWLSRRDLTSDEFSALWSDLAERDYRLHDQETYVVDGQRRWAGVWIENRENLLWASRRGLTSSEFSAEFERRRADMMPVDYERYETGAGPRYAIAWVENPDNIGWTLWRDGSSEDFAKKFDDLSSDHRMIDLEVTDGTYAGIWHANDGRGWRARRDLTPTSWSNHWNRYRDLGFRLVDFEIYETQDGTRYAGVWRQNGERENWERREDVEKLVDEYMEDFGAPGMAVAVLVDGETKLHRGFGHADIDAGVWMDARHVNRLASVSKPVGATIAMQMVEEGLIDLDDPVGDYIDVPAGHTYTIGDLISHRSCIGHYVDDDIRGKQWATAAEVTPHITDEPLVPDCTFGDDSYSTDGWTVFAAVAEAVDGATIEQIVETRISSAGMPTLQLEELAETNHRRAKIYGLSDDGFVEAERDDLSWKPLGGGMQASVTDLARFGQSMLDGDLIGPATFDLQTTPPNGSSSYAHGWSTFGSGSSFRVAHTGRQHGAHSYLRLMPEDDVVIVVMTNRRTEKGSVNDLVVDIGQLVVGY